MRFDLSSTIGVRTAGEGDLFHSKLMSGTRGVGDVPWHPDESIAGTYRHEYGHHFWYRALEEGERAWWKEQFQYAQLVSGYAQTNEVEFFAEAFSAFTHAAYGAESATSLPPVIHKRLEGLMAKPQKWGGKVGDAKIEAMSEFETTLSNLGFGTKEKQEAALARIQN